MDMFVPDEELARLEAAATGGNPACPGAFMLVELAWHYRQRDQQKSYNLCQHAVQQLRQARLAPTQRQALLARIRLIRGEHRWLFAELDAASHTTRRGLAQFQKTQDWCGLADACWLMSRICGENGDFPSCAQFLQQAEQFALASNDALRIAYIDGEHARFQAFNNFASSKQRWEHKLRQALPGANPAAASIMHYYLGLITGLAGDYGYSATHFIQCQEHALTHGQIQIAIMAGGNTANTFCELNDYQSALEWGQRTLDLALPTGWVRTLCLAKAQMAQALRHLKQFDAAGQLLEQSYAALKHTLHARNTLVTVLHLGDLALDQQQFAKAQGWFQLGLDHALDPNQFDVLLDAKRGLAKALSRQNQPGPALAIAQDALRQVQALQIRDEQINLLQLLAEIHSQHADLLAGEQEPSHAQAALSYLQQARTIAASIDGYIIPGQLLDDLARALARTGDYASAYEVSMQAHFAREQTHNQSATSRAIALQVRLNTERAQAEGEYHRQLAASEAQRAELLQQTSSTLQQLSLIGQELTAQLNLEAVLDSLKRHMQQLLDVSHFSIYLMNDDGQSLYSALSTEAGNTLPRRELSMQDPHSNSVRAVREQREILVDWAPDAIKHTRIPGFVHTLSELFAPLMTGPICMGVMTVQSVQRFAYGEREKLIFRTLCAYGAIALANAKANLRLQENAIQLDLAKKKAEQATRLKSDFLATMSHEIRTPMNAVIGLAHLALRTGLTPKQAHYIQKIHSSGLSLLGILNDILDLSKIEAGKMDIETIAFDLDEVLQHVADVTCQKASEKNLEYLFQIPPDLPRHYHGDPLRLGQILINLLNNAIKFCDEGEVLLSCQLLAASGQTPATLHFSVRDSGIGMNPEQCQLLFQAFRQAEQSTTRRYGGTGLGLSISQYLVQLMGGQIQVESEMGKGSCFSFALPHCRPAKQPAAIEIPAPVSQAPCLVLGPKRLGRSILINNLRALCQQVEAVEQEHQALAEYQLALQQERPYRFLFLGEMQVGVRLCQAIEQHGWPTPHVILLSHVEQANEHPCFSQIVYKPLIFSRLRQSLLNCFPQQIGASHPDPGQRLEQTLAAQQIHVLVAEDNDINQQIALELLAEQGVLVDIAIDGQHVLNKLRAVKSPPYKIIFMDLEMPVLDGLSTTRLIRQDEQFNHIPIIAMTAHVLADMQQQCLADGMQDYLAKPINPERIREILRRWLPGQQQP